MLETLIVAAVRDTGYVLFAVGLLIVSFHLWMHGVGQNFKEAMTKIDDEPLSLAIASASVVIALALVISAVFH